ncbi:Slp family lipoprotein [Glaciecola sp. MF2-115]|uniref:Slp family lipoprotein n=1 Tax=Glaciecola sp. MF2-115 TaxID=3384827 RepID=UPI0039A1CE20
MHSLFKSSVVAVALLISGCVIVPEPIKVSDTDDLLSFESVINGDSSAQGAEVRWGGEIVSVENKKEYSEFEILHYPNNHYGKPRANMDSAGRFKVRVTGFIDPLVFETGRLITFLGELGEPTEGIIGEQTYIYPVVLANGYYMWKDTEEYQVSGFYYSELSPFWGMGIRHHYYRPYGFFHNRTTIRVDRKKSKSSKNASKGSVSSGSTDRSKGKTSEQSK